MSAYITAEATAQELGTCILGWFDDGEIRKLCGLDGAVRLVITLGYAKDDDKLRTKKRKDNKIPKTPCKQKKNGQLKSYPFGLSDKT